MDLLAIAALWAGALLLHRLEGRREARLETAPRRPLELRDGRLS